MNLSAAYIQKQKEWKEEGRFERQQEMVIALLQEGISPETLAKTTGLSIEAIKKLRST
jgi:anionic cell wall polymer biosynthesis LytR-Cps2A-Psr (LCP) family protein